jgi:hypothetical protein
MSETSRLMMWALLFFLAGVTITTSVFWTGYNISQAHCECEETLELKE